MRRRSEPTTRYVRWICFAVVGVSALGVSVCVCECGGCGVVHPIPRTWRYPQPTKLLCLCACARSFLFHLPTKPSACVLRLREPTNERTHAQANERANERTNTLDGSPSQTARGARTTHPSDKSVAVHSLRFIAFLFVFAFCCVCVCVPCTLGTIHSSIHPSIHVHAVARPDAAGRRAARNDRRHRVV